MILEISIQREERQLFLDRGITDLFKILCCLLVASSHYAQDYICQNGAADALMFLISSQGGYLGVALFFFMSGYGLSNSQNHKELSFVRFVKRRISKVYFPAIFVSLIWVLMLFFYPSLQTQPLGSSIHITNSNILEYLAKVFFLQFNDSVLWFVKVILILYLVFFLYHKLKRNCSFLYSFLFLILSAALISCMTYLLIAPFASVSISAFVFGVLVSSYPKAIARYVNLIAMSGFMLIALLAVLNYSNSIILHGLFNYAFILGWIWLSVVFKIVLSFDYSHATNISYDLYLTHKKVLVILNDVGVSLPIFLYLIISIIVATIVYFVRKIVRL